MLSSVHVATLHAESQCGDDCDVHQENVQYGVYKDVFDLKGHLTKFKVSESVQNLLKTEDIDIDELVTFTVKNVEDWCKEHSLKTIETIRLVNAIKSLPNSAANYETLIRTERGFIYLNQKEQLQREKFEEMITNVQALMENIDNINQSRQINEQSLITQVNDTCDKIQTFVENIRADLLSQVRLIDRM